MENGEELEIFSSRDGDTIWSGKDEDQPEYVYMLFEEAQAKAINEAETAAQDTSTQKRSKTLKSYLVFPNVLVFRCIQNLCYIIMYIMFNYNYY